MLDVVEAHQRELFRDVDAPLARGLDDSDRDDVVHGEDRRRRLLEVEETQGGFVATTRVDRARIRHVLRALSNLRGLERIPVTLEPLSRRRDVERLA